MNVEMNTLFVTTDGASVSKDHETVVIKVDGQPRAQVPLLHLQSIVCMGRSFVTPELMAACAEAGISIAFLTPTGRFLARVEGVPGGNVLLRRAQYRVADSDSMSLSIARSFVLGKITNTRQFLLHAKRDASAERQGALAAVCDRLAQYLFSLADAASVESVRGVEGIAAKDYFGVFPLLIKRGEEEFAFKGRSRRPPKDRVNALLSFGYALLMQDCSAAASSVGLDPAVGYLHEERPGRLCLALDLMEELRVPMVDRLVLAMVNRKQFSAADFIEESSGGFRMTDDARKRFLVGYQESKQTEVRHEFLGQNTFYGKVPHLQSLLLARTLRRDVEVYPPFAIR